MGKNQQGPSDRLCLARPWLGGEGNRRRQLSAAGGRASDSEPVSGGGINTFLGSAGLVNRKMLSEVPTSAPEAFGEPGCLPNRSWLQRAAILPGLQSKVQTWLRV